MTTINIKNILFYLLIFNLCIVSCKREEMTNPLSSENNIHNVPEMAWRRLEEKKIFFGHQSVGNNIINGLTAVLQENTDIKITINETKEPEIFINPVFAHYRIGNNFDPSSKNADFSQTIEHISPELDYAFYKYCYVDIAAQTEIEKVFNAYKNTMNLLKLKYPKTTFIHITVPLVVVQTGPKAWIKKIIGREIGGYRDNIKRNQFNDLLRRHYEKNEPVFDLAAFEATYPDGRKMTFRQNGRTYFSLVPEYARDGRHLNDWGSKLIAEQLLIFLANLD